MITNIEQRVLNHLSKSKELGYSYFFEQVKKDKIKVDWKVIEKLAEVTEFSYGLLLYRAVREEVFDGPASVKKNILKNNKP